MNQDVGQLLGQLKDQDPWMLGVIVGLVVSLVLAIVLGRAALTANSERRDLADQHAANQANIQQIKAMQQASPEGLKDGIASAQAQLDELLGGVPTSEQVSEELVNYYAYANALNSRLVRQEKAVDAGAEEGVDVYGSDLFLLEVHGEIPDLMRFLAQVGSGPYRTFMLGAINIGPNGPAMAEADLRVFYSDYGQRPRSSITPTLEITQEVPLEGSLSQADPGMDVEKLRALHDEALEAENWALVVASGRQLIKAGIDESEVAETLYLGHLRWAELLAEEGQTDEAMAEYRAALDIRPEAAEARRGLEQLEDAGLPDSKVEASPVPLVVRATPEPTATVAVVATATPVVHRVQAGDSLLGLANRYRTTVSAIKEANALQSNVIYVGQELAIPIAVAVE